MTTMFLTSVLMAVSLVLGGLVAFLLLRRPKKADAPMEIRVQTITERVRAVGKLVGLEVSAKEIATVKHGWSWLPPLLLTEARLAMIFQFEKQYHVDLSALAASDIERDDEGRVTITMPAIEGQLRLVDVKPYDIQQGKVLGLVDVIQMTAERQTALMAEAQKQAAGLFDRADSRYRAQAAEAIEKQIRQLLEHLDIECEVRWRANAERSEPHRMAEFIAAEETVAAE